MAKPVVIPGTGSGGIEIAGIGSFDTVTIPQLLRCGNGVEAGDTQGLDRAIHADLNRLVEAIPETTHASYRLAGWIRAEGLNPDLLIGHSRGAGLSVLAALLDTQIGDVVAIAPPSLPMSRPELFGRFGFAAISTAMSRMMSCSGRQQGIDVGRFVQDTWNTMPISSELARFDLLGMLSLHDRMRQSALQWKNGESGNAIYENPAWDNLINRRILLALPAADPIYVYHQVIEAYAPALADYPNIDMVVMNGGHSELEWNLPVDLRRWQRQGRQALRDSL